MRTLYTYKTIALLEQINVVWILGICSFFFLILLILGIRKSYKLKAENDKLIKASDELIKEEEKEYTDFTEGHMYQRKKEPSDD
ncbi:hypothetical protein ACFS5M_08640 [Lacinutrix iliipiscaria]|uniref:Cbb3-type cytochrome oxidase component FixQ n=1 Tax=Lacinutrix iliipiscaria TaxID=1230532 RepID=A0ABW5WMP5_9FLAO